MCYKETFSTQGITKTDLYRRLKCRMGRTLRSQLNRRGLVSHRKTPTYQPIGNEGSFPGPAVLQNDLPEQSRFDCLRQHLHGVVHQQTGRYKIRRTLHSNVKNPDLVQPQQCHTQSKTRTGSLNVIADSLSRRNQIQPTERSLYPQIFKQVSKIWESLQVHLFVTRLNTKLALYVSLTYNYFLLSLHFSTCCLFLRRYLLPGVVHYSQTCEEQPPSRKCKSGCSSQVVVLRRFSYWGHESELCQLFPYVLQTKHL